MTPTQAIVMDTLFVTVICMVIGFGLTLATTGLWSRQLLWRGIAAGLAVETGIIAAVWLSINHWNGWTLVIAAPIFTSAIFWLIKTRHWYEKH